MGSVIEILIQQALAYLAGGDITSALAPLQRAFTLAEPEGSGRNFINEGPSMAQLLSAAAAQGIMPRYTAKLLAAFPSAEPQQAAPFIPHSSLVDPLSNRELEVLHLIAAGLTNQQIADRLYLSPHTVKVHTRNIYSKLDVHHRAQAVARGKELGII